MSLTTPLPNFITIGFVRKRNKQTDRLACISMDVVNIQHFIPFSAHLWIYYWEKVACVGLHLFNYPLGKISSELFKQSSHEMVTNGQTAGVIIILVRICKSVVARKIQYFIPYFDYSESYFIKKVVCLGFRVFKYPLLRLTVKT